MTDQPLREQLVRFMDWDEAHVGFDKAIDGIPAQLRGTRATGFEHTIWQLLEHIRIAQEDILDFCVNDKYRHTMKWPEDYWPKNPAPPSADAWEQSIAAVKRDRAQFVALAKNTADLFALVPTGKGHQSYFRAPLLVNDHNAYHLGQIVAVRRALGAWS